MPSKTHWDKYYIALEKVGSLNDLPEPLITLLNLTSLLIDIEFKKNYDRSLDWSQGRRYRVFSHGGEYHKGSYDPLISIELFDKVQVAMGWRSTKIRNSTRGYDYMLK